MTAVHEGGAISDVAISAVVHGFVWECSLFGPAGELHAPQVSEDENAEVRPVIAAGVRRGGSQWSVARVERPSRAVLAAAASAFRRRLARVCSEGPGSPGSLSA